MTKALLMRSTVLASLIVAATAGVAQAVEWRGWNIHPEGYPNSVALEEFAQNITEATDGRIEAQVYNNAVLGDQPDAIEQLRNGGIDFANFNMGPMGPIVPMTDVLSLPFLFNSVDQMHAVMDGEIGQRFADALAERGIVALSWFDSGARSFYNTQHPIEQPSDVEGLKIRVMNNDLYVQMVDELGGNATPMAYGEVFQSLRTGVLDGAENNYPSFDTSNHYEAAKYYSVTGHLILPECLCIAQDSWDALSAEDQETVRQAAEETSARQRELWAEFSEASKKKVEEAGIEINEVADKSAFQDRMQPIYDRFFEERPDMEALVEEIRATKAE